MKNETLNYLLSRNKTILDVLIKKVKESFADAVDFIAITGSFLTNDFYEKSDLDIFIVINSDEARELNKSFIFDDIGFDIYTKKWSDFDDLIKCNDIFLGTLLDIEVVYYRNPSILEEIKVKQTELSANLVDMDQTAKRVDEAYKQLIDARKELQKSSDLHDGIMLLYRIINIIVFICFSRNQTYLKQGIRRIPEEILKLDSLPKDFSKTFKRLTMCNRLENIMDICNDAINDISEWLNIPFVMEDIDVIASSDSWGKVDVSYDNIKGIYEEIYSNWKNKMRQATMTNNRFLSFMTMCATQELYNELFSFFNIEKFDLITKYDPLDLSKNEVVFNQEMNKWKRIYVKVDRKVLEFMSLDKLKDNLYS